MIKNAFIPFASSFALFFIMPFLAGADDCDRAARLTEEVSQSVDFSPATVEQKFREAAAYCGKSAALHYNLGVALYTRGKAHEAEAEFDEALRLKPNFAKAMNALAAVVYTKKESEYDRALKLVKKAIEQEPRNKQFRDTFDLVNAYVDFPPPTTASNENAIAVIIGNKNYKNAGIPSVEYADRDAIIMKEYLIESLGFNKNNIIFYNDANYIDFLKVFGDTSDHKGILYNRTKSGRSDVFIFYSGHGAPDTNTKKAFLAPADMDPYAVKHTSYSLDLLYENLSKLSQERNPRSLTLVLDACFSGASSKGMVIKDASPIALEITAPMLKLKDAAVFTSSQGNQISSWYPEQKHGLFTYYFLKAIKDTLASGKPLSSGDIEKKLLGPDSVNDAALRLYSREQTPQITGSKNIVLVK